MNITNNTSIASTTVSLSATQAAEGILLDMSARTDSPDQLNALSAALEKFHTFRGQGQAAISPQPELFTLDPQVASLTNPAAVLQGLRAAGNSPASGQALLQQMTALMNQLSVALTPKPGSSTTPLAAAPAPAAGFTASSVPGLLADTSGWSSIDSMMAQANTLAQSKNPSDQLRAQQLMNQASQMFQTISKIMQQQAELAKTAIQNIR